MINNINMKIDVVAKELFNKIRGRFENVTLGNSDGLVTSVPEEARFFDFDFENNGDKLGKVSLSINEEEGVVVIYSKDFVENSIGNTKHVWFDFLKELRVFSKKRLLPFEVRDINKSNLTKRDYANMASRTGEVTMRESTMYGTNKTSFQRIGNAKLSIKHSQTLEDTTNRTTKIDKIFIESNEGEKFKYPFKHLTGARAMARHVSEGGTPYDDFGKHIIGLSEELVNLNKFKKYMSRSTVMAESLLGYVDVVKERVADVKKEIQNLQKEAYYKSTIEEFVPIESASVPADVTENWIDELTIKQFNEDLKDVFPYIYKLVSEQTKAQCINPEDILDEGEGRCCKDCGCREYRVKPSCSCKHDSHDHNGSWWIPISQYKESKVRENYDAVEKVYNDLLGQFGEVYEVYDPEYGHDTNSHVVKHKDDNGKAFWAVYNHDGKIVETFYSEKSASTFAEKNHDALMKNKIKANEAKSSDYNVGDQITMNGRWHDIVSIEEDGTIFIADEDGEEYEFTPGTEDRHDPAVDIEGNAYVKAVRMAKMNGKKKGDKIDHPDPDQDDIVLASKEEKKTPLGEFILSYFDKETGKFPKGETAVLTMVEKDYGDEYVKKASQFIERLGHAFEQYKIRKNAGMIEGTFDDFGLKDLGKELDQDDDEGGFAQAPMFDQLGKILDSASSPNPVKTVKTDDGKEMAVSPQQARVLRMMMTAQNIKPNIKSKFIRDVQSSAGLHDFVDVKDHKEMPKIFMQKYMG